MKCKTALATVLVACSTAAVAATAASASDPGGCAPNGRSIHGQREYTCSLWRARVPVYGSYSTDPAYGGRVVGHLYKGGRANWFLWQCSGNRAALGRYWNYWWAYTLADNGRWGYVPLTYFAGGANGQRSSKLPYGDYTHLCGGATTHPS